MITSSSFRALQGQRVRLYLSILRFWVLLSLFQGVFLVHLLKFFSFRRFRRLFGARQLTARVSLAHVVIGSLRYRRFRGDGDVTTQVDWVRGC